MRERSDGKATREAILEAAETEFAACGYDAASTRRICARADVNVALVNRYFGSKENLYRVVAKRLFGDLGAPMAELPASVHDAEGWRAALRMWVEDFLFMTLPTQKAQKRCAALFRQEVTHPTKFHAEFKRDFGKPVYDVLRNLLAMAVEDEAQLELWTTSIWSQVSVYALADVKWHDSFQPKGVSVREWADQVRDFICETLFHSLSFKQLGGV